MKYVKKGEPHKRGKLDIYCKRFIRYYKCLRSQKIFCPAVNSNVKFTDLGYYHIQKERNKKENSDRYKFLCLAVKLIRRRSEIFETFQHLGFYHVVLMGRIENRNVKVILRKHGEYYYFYSWCLLEDNEILQRV